MSKDPKTKDLPVKNHSMLKVEGKSLSKVVQINEAKLQDHLGTVVRDTVEQTLHQMLDAKVDEFCGAKRYERSPDRVDNLIWFLRVKTPYKA